jgi:glycerol-3-phosphate dehydrogenase (NAD(P)+)
MDNIAVIGSGAWGTALATIAAKRFSRVNIITRNVQVISDINNLHENKLYLPSITLPESIIASSDYNLAKHAEILIIAIPAQHIREVLANFSYDNFNKTIIICSKGVEQNSLKLMSEVVSEILPAAKVAILSGPNFAHEVASNFPSAATIAASDLTLANFIADKLNNEMFRIYTSDDIISTQICGAAKNVLAIACGIVMGKKFGENAKAALITRGIAEIGRLSIAKGGNIKTMLGLGGIGDIMLTCNSAKSRNTSLGIELAQGANLEDIIKKRHTVAEGVTSAASIRLMANKLNISMPIIEAVAKILFEKKDINQIIEELLKRPSSNE